MSAPPGRAYPECSQRRNLVDDSWHLVWFNNEAGRRVGHHADSPDRLTSVLVVDLDLDPRACATNDLEHGDAGRIQAHPLDLDLASGVPAARAIQNAALDTSPRTTSSRGLSGWPPVTRIASPAFSTRTPNS